MISSVGPNPGLAWINKEREWEDLGFVANDIKVIKDAGIVIVEYEDSTKRLDLTVFGYSGTATRATGYALAADSKVIQWPPTEIASGRFADLYAFRFDFNPDDDTAGGYKTVEIDRMDPEILKSFVGAS